MLRRQIQSAVNEGRIIVPQMKVDQNHFPAHTHMFELSNLKVLIRPNQAESTRGKNIFIGEERSEPSRSHQEAPAKEIPEDSLKNSTFGGQKQKKEAESAKTGLETGLTGQSGNSGKNSRNKREKERPSFKELLAKYEKKGVVQKQKGRPDKAKDTKPSSSQEQSSLGQGNLFNGPIAPWYCWYSCYMPLDYSRMHMQSYYIHYPSIYPSFASQRPISDNLIKKDIDCSKEYEKGIKED